MVEPDVQTGRPPLEPEAFEEASRDAHWDKNLSLEDQYMLKKVICEFPMVFAHGSHLLRGVNTEDFEIRLNVTEDNYSKTLQKTAYPCSPAKRTDIENYIKELLKLGVLEELDHTPRNAIISSVIIQYQ